MRESENIQDVVRSLTERMVSTRHWHDASFINMPMVYPSGGFVTVQLSPAGRGIKVSDAGYAYREAELFGAGRSFSKTARTVARTYDVQAGLRAIYVDVSRQDVERAVFDVSAASFMVADRIVSRVSQDDEATISETLKGRLDRLFPEKVDYESKVVGASSTEWDISAVAKLDGRRAVFQAVTNYPASIYKTSTAFHDLSALDDAPLLVSVISSKADFGASVGILAQAGRVIEVGQEDSVYLRAVA